MSFVVLYCTGIVCELLLCCTVQGIVCELCCVVLYRALCVSSVVLYCTGHCV